MMLNLKPMRILLMEPKCKLKVWSWRLSWLTLVRASQFTL